MIAVRPSRQAVARWNEAYAEQTAAMFAASKAPAGHVAAVRRLARAYCGMAAAWRVLAADLAVPLWARHAAAIAAEEFQRRACVEDNRADLDEQQNKES